MKLYTNLNIITCEERDFPNGYILVEGTRIKAVGDMANAPSGGDLQIIDLAGMTACPGFVDAHSHIGLFGDSMGREGRDGNETADPITPHLRALDGINPMDKCFAEALSCGVTSVMVGPGSANPIAGTFAALKTHGTCIDDMLIKEEAAMKFAFGENPKMLYGRRDKAPVTRMGTAALVREALGKARRYDRSVFDMKSESLKRVLDGGMLVKAHAHRADDIFTAIRIAKEFGLKMTIEHCTDGHLIAKELKEKGVSACIGPAFGARTKPELANKSFETAAALCAAGVPVAIITDHPEIPQEELLTCAMLAVRDGMDEREALRAITINAAALCGIAERVGSIKEGKDADFCIFSDNPMKFGGKPQHVVVMGEWKVESGKLKVES